jgi:hypothetical protein
MNPSRLRATVVAKRIAWVNQMMAGLWALPLDTYDTF